MPLLLAGAIVRRADLADGMGAIEVRSPGESAVIVIGGGRGAQGVGLVDPNTRREAWGARLPPGVSASKGESARVEGARVLGLGLRAVAFDKGGQTLVVALDKGRVVVREGSAGEPASEDERAAYEARGRELLRVIAEEAHTRHRERALRAIARGVQRVERRIAATRGDLARLADAEALAAQAQWLVAEAARAPRGATSLRVTDWTSGEPRTLEVPLDPSKPARAQVDAMFERARRLKRGARIAEERIAKAEAIRDVLVEASRGAGDATTAGEIEAAFAQARAAAPKDVAFEAQASTGPGPKQPASAAFRTFVGCTGARILVGKGARHNDELTFGTARPHDLWLHAKGRAGAHVIVPLPKGSSCPAEVLVDAAHLAAHFSEAREEAIVEVEYTPRRYLRKPRGSAPGFVVVDREKVIPVRLERGRVTRLLETER